MRFINELLEGEQIKSVYLVKEKRTGETKTGKPYETVVLADKTGTVDGKIWDVNSPAIYDYDPMDFIEIIADVKVYNNSLQLNIRSLRKAEEGTYIPSDYVATSKNDVDVMFDELISYINSVENNYLQALLKAFFVEDGAFVKKFKEHSAAKTVHHSFSGGLVEHTLGVTRMCNFLAGQYRLINRDLLITAAICHDIGKIEELSDFPLNDYTDPGQLLGHIVIGSEMIAKKADEIAGFPKKLENQLKHCILSHHGLYEYGSPKLPSTIEAIALNRADDCDAKMEIMIEALMEKSPASDKDGWMGYSKFLDTNIRRTNISE